MAEEDYGNATIDLGVGEPIYLSEFFKYAEEVRCGKEKGIEQVVHEFWESKLKV